MRKPSEYRIKSSISLSKRLRTKLVLLADYYECTESRVISTLLEQALDPPGFKNLEAILDEQLSQGKKLEEVLVQAGHRKISNKTEILPNN